MTPALLQLANEVSLLRARRLYELDKAVPDYRLDHLHEPERHHTPNRDLWETKAHQIPMGLPRSAVPGR